MYVIYWRVEANVVDMRQFKNLEELAQWLFDSLKFEPIALVGIYDGGTEIGKVEKDYVQFVKYFEKPENERETLYRFRKAIDK